MEAVAKHDFNATAEDELSFKKMQILKVSLSPNPYISFAIFPRIQYFHLNFKMCD